MNGFDRTTWVVTLQSGAFLARCACDWTGQLRLDVTDAQRDANLHAAEHRDPMPYPAPA